MTLYPHMHKIVNVNLLQKNASIQEWLLYKRPQHEKYSEFFFMFGAILKATNSSFQKGMTFCRSIYVKKVMKLLAFIFEQPSYKWRFAGKPIIVRFLVFWSRVGLPLTKLSGSAHETQLQLFSRSRTDFKQLVYCQVLLYNCR